MTSTLSDHDHGRVLELSWALAGTRSPEELAAAALEVTHRVVDAEQAGFSEVNLRDSTHQVSLFPDSPASRDVLPRFSEFANPAHHPVFAELLWRRRRTPFRLSSLVPHKQFLRSPLYEAVYKPRDIRYQAVVPIRTDDDSLTGNGYTFNRAARDFEGDDVARLFALQAVLSAHHAALQVRHGEQQPTDGDAVRGIARLTPREREVLLLVASGMTAVAIGHLLRITPGTVRKHTENSYSKLNVHDRLEAASCCRRAGLLS